MKPFLKWAGGKRWLVNSLPWLFDVPHRRYVEPFLGSGAVYFHLEPQVATLNDENEALVNLYLALREDWAGVYRRLKAHAERHSNDYYYEVRAKKFRAPAARAAQLLYLNRTCWNGLYRENLKGQFNVPRGTKDTVLFPDDDFHKVACLLERATITSGDFSSVMRTIKDGDLVFIDPPYTVKHNSNGFVKYNENIFSWRDQERLADLVRNRAGCGAKMIITNALHDSIKELYQGVGEVYAVSRASVLSGDAAYRGKTEEALILVGFNLQALQRDAIAGGRSKAITLREVALHSA